MTEVEVRFVEASRLALEPGDTILLRVPEGMDPEQFMPIAAQAGAQFPGHPVVILAPGIELEAVGLQGAVDRFTVSRETLRAALTHADRCGIGRNEIARIASPAYSRATVLKMLTEDNGPAPVSPAEEGGLIRRVAWEWINQS